MTEAPLTDSGSGVDYEQLDPYKRHAQQLAAMTDDFANRLGVKPLSWTRGESVMLYKVGSRYFGFVIEGLGTKNLVADELLLGGSLRTYYDSIAQDNAAMIVNDGITLGVFPFSLGLHVAVGRDEWFTENVERYTALNEGFLGAAEAAGTTWGPGETPSLKGIVSPDTALLSGAAMFVSRGSRILNPATIREGDHIFLLGSSGIHANGLTGARTLAGTLPDGYATKLSDGRPFGETLLDPTYLYVRFVEACMMAGIELRYGINITGHGWRKLMRAKRNLEYVIEYVPKPQPVFDFLQEHTGKSGEDMYGAYNMGAGFALIVAGNQATLVEALADQLNLPYSVINAGYVREAKGPRVTILPKGIEFGSERLKVR